MRCLKTLLPGLVCLLLSACAGAEAPTASDMAKRTAGTPERKEGAAGAAGAAGAEKHLPRKVRYTAEVRLVVKDLPEAELELKRLVTAEKGLVAKADVHGSPGRPRHGQWTVRVPVERLDAFREAVLKLGEPERNSLDSEDMSEEFYDLQGRVANMKAKEETLRKMFDKASGKVEDVLAVWRELTSVRGEIERLEGRLRVVTNLTDLTTVTVTLRERSAYLAEAPTFTTRAGRAFQDSVEALKSFGEGVVLFLVAATPWAPLVALVVLPLWLWRRRRARPVTPV